MTAVAPTVRHMARGCIAFARLDLLLAAQYRSSLVIWSMVSVVEALIYMSVWQSVAAGNGGSTGGFDERDFAAYFLVMLVVRELVTSSLPWQRPGQVRTGKLATKLVRPLHPIVQIYGNDLGFMVNSLVAKVPVFLVLAVVYDPRIDPPAISLVVAVLLLPLAILARVLCGALVACTSLWLVRIDGIRGCFLMVMLLLGGGFAPIAVLPAWLAAIAKALPFYWSLGYPVELLQGHAGIDDAWLAFAVLAAWSGGLLALLQPVWRAGTRAYEAVGQ